MNLPAGIKVVSDDGFVQVYEDDVLMFTVIVPFEGGASESVVEDWLEKALPLWVSLYQDEVKE